MDIITNPVIRVIALLMFIMIILDSVEWGFNGQYDNNAGTAMSGMVTNLVNLPVAIICYVFKFIGAIIGGVLTAILSIFGADVQIDLASSMDCSL